MSGPEGVGKSVLAYMIAQIFKMEKEWLTIYIPDCRHWVKMTDLQAKGFFLDRVRDALDNPRWKENYEKLIQELDAVPKAVAEKGTEDQWCLAASIPGREAKENLEFLYNRVVLRLKNGAANVLFVCDEINALWEVRDNAPLFKLAPWNLTNFDSKWMKKGALLVTGTTDYDFVSVIPDGLKDYVYPIGKCSDEEIDLLKTLDQNQILQQIATLDPAPWEALVDAAGNVPREFRLYVDQVAPTKLGKRIADVLSEGESEEPEHKKRKTEVLNEVNESIQKWRESNVQRHRDMLHKVLTGTWGVDVFKEELFEACECIFLRGGVAPINSQVLRVPNFVITDKGIYPTTVDAQKVYFDWFCKEESRRDRFSEDIIKIKKPGPSLCGGDWVCNIDGEGATLSFVFFHDGKYYGLTVGHLFEALGDPVLSFIQPPPEGVNEEDNEEGETKEEGLLDRKIVEALPVYVIGKVVSLSQSTDSAVFQFADDIAVESYKIKVAAGVKRDIKLPRLESLVMGLPPPTPGTALVGFGARHGGFHANVPVPSMTRPEVNRPEIPEVPPGCICITNAESRDRITYHGDCGTIFIDLDCNGVYFHYAGTQSEPWKSFGHPLWEVMLKHTQLGGTSETPEENFGGNEMESLVVGVASLALEPIPTSKFNVRVVAPPPRELDGGSLKWEGKQGACHS